MLPQSFIDLPLAHRALHDVSAGRPENSMAAIKAAIDHGYGIEVDVQLSADDRALVFHDYALDRLTDGTGPIRRYAHAELASFQLTGSGEPIPGLDDVLALVAGRVPLLVEIKDQDGALGENVGPLEQAVAASIDGYEGPLAVMSFNPHSVALMRDLAPDTPRGLVTDPFLPKDWPAPAETLRRLAEIPDYDRVGACFISHNRKDLDRPRVAELKSQGAQILCWTVRSEAEEADARHVADNITFESYLAEIRT